MSDHSYIVSVQSYELIDQYEEAIKEWMNWMNEPYDTQHATLMIAAGKYYLQTREELLHHIRALEVAAGKSMPKTKPNPRTKGEQ